MRWLTQFWDFVDKRDIDKHCVAMVVLWGTKILTDWAMAFAIANAAKSGVEVAAIIGAVTGPYMVLQGACIKFYFTARTVT